jgi:hypothetical protein
MGAWGFFVLSVLLSPLFLAQRPQVAPLVHREAGTGHRLPEALHQSVLKCYVTVAVVSGVIIAVLFKPLRSRIDAGVGKLVDWFVGSGETRAVAPQEEDTFIPPPSDR